MADWVVGIDIGENTIKAVQVKRSVSGTWTVTASAVVAIQKQGDIKAALANLFEHHALGHGRYVLNYPSSTVLFRQVLLPFTGRKEIDQTLTYELESKLPFPLEDMVVDYLITPRGGQGDVFAAAAKKSELRKRIETIESFGKKVDVLDIDGFSIVSFLRSHKVAGGNSILLDIGEKSVLVIFFSTEGVIQARCFNRMGGAVKTDAGYANLIVQVKNTAAFLAWNGSAPEGFAKIFSTGGGAHDNLLLRGLSAEMGIPVIPLDIAASASIKVAGEAEEQWDPLLMNQALSLAIRPRNSGFNFRQKLGKDGAGHTGVLKNIKRVGGAVAAVLLLGLMELYLDYSLTSARVLRLKREIQTVFKQNAPEVTRIVDPLQQLQIMIAEARKMSGSMRDICSPRTFLDLLLDISSLVSPAAPFSLQSITYDNDRVVLKGESPNSAAVESVKNELGRLKSLSSVTSTVSALGRKDNKVEFEMQLTLKDTP